MVTKEASAPIDKRAAILQATLSLLASRGFHGFSMKQLADMAGVAAGTIYLYFRDKQDLILQLHDEILRRVAEAVFADYSPELDFRQQHRLMCRNIWHFFTANPEILLSKSQFDHLPPEALQERKEDVRNRVRPMVDMFERGKAAGIIKDLPEEVLFGLGMEPFFALGRQCHLGLVEVDEHCLERAIDAAWDGISVRS